MLEYDRIFVTNKVKKKKKNVTAIFKTKKRPISTKFNVYLFNFLL